MTGGCTQEYAVGTMQRSKFESVTFGDFNIDLLALDMENPVPMLTEFSLCFLEA